MSRALQAQSLLYLLAQNLGHQLQVGISLKPKPFSSQSRIIIITSQHSVPPQ